MARLTQPLEVMPATPPAPDETAAAVFAEQVRLLYRLSRPAYGGTLAVALIVVAGLWGEVSPSILGSWFALVAATTAARFVLYRQYGTAEPARDARSWSTRFVLGAVAMGSLWGVLGSLLLAAADWVLRAPDRLRDRGHGRQRASSADARQARVHRIHAGGVAATHHRDVCARRFDPPVHRRHPDGISRRDDGRLPDHASNSRRFIANALRKCRSR